MLGKQSLMKYCVTMSYSKQQYRKAKLTEELPTSCGRACSVFEMHRDPHCSRKALAVAMAHCKKEGGLGRGPRIILHYASKIHTALPQR